MEEEKIQKLRQMDRWKTFWKSADTGNIWMKTMQDMDSIKKDSATELFGKGCKGASGYIGDVKSMNY